MAAPNPRTILLIVIDHGKGLGIMNNDDVVAIKMVLNGIFIYPYFPNMYYTRGILSALILFENRSKLSLLTRSSWDRAKEAPSPVPERFHLGQFCFAPESSRLKSPRFLPHIEDNS